MTARRCVVPLLALFQAVTLAASARAQTLPPLALAMPLPAPVRAQPEEAEGYWKGVAGASLAATEGNSSTQALLLNLDVARTTETTKTTLVAQVNEGKNKVDGRSRTSAGKWETSAQHNRDISLVMFGFGKLGLERDRVTGLALRTQVAAGFGRHLLRSDADTVDIFAGLSHTDDRYDIDKTIGDETARRFRTTGLLLGEETSHQLTENTFFKQRLEYYPGLTGEKAQLMRFNASLSVSMSRALALTVGVTDTYNSRVAAGQKRNDVSLFTGISLKIGQ